MQLELSYWGPTTLRGAIADFMARRTDDLAEATIVDYRERAAWLLRELGELTPIASLTFGFLDDFARRFRGVIRNVTVKKRLVFLRAVLKYAHARGLLEHVPALPRLKNDGEARTTLHTVEQWQVFRSYVPPGRFRKFYDLGFWTLHHTHDLFSMERWMLAPDRPYHDEAGNELGRGCFWRRNHKNRRCQGCWVPMQPELKLLARDILFDVPAIVIQPIIGRLWNVRRTLHMAADRAMADGHDIPRISPIDLRRSGASMLSGRGYPTEAVRIILGHEGGDSRTQGGESTQPSTATRHYMRPTPALLAPKQR